MAGVSVSYGTYAFFSTLSFLAVILRTWYIHEELYSVVAVLSTGKIALALLYNFAFMVLLGMGKLAMQLMVGQLRDLEVEHVLDSGRGFLLDTVLFLVLSSPTLDGAEVTTHALAKYIFIVVALKTAHLVVQIRGATCLGMFVSCGVSILKFGMHVIDLRLDNGWASKSAVIFYLELIHDVTSLAIFLLFMSVFFITQPSRLPLYMTADIIHVVKALYKRILSFRKYRSLTRNLETRFPDATHEELEAADTCIICRDLLFEGSKRLPCSHVFHVDCLRSWLVQQQSCPTCRADIPADDSSAFTAPVDHSSDGRGGQLGTEVEAEQRPGAERAAPSEPATSFTAEATRDSQAPDEMFRRGYADGETSGDGRLIAGDARTQDPAAPALSSAREPARPPESISANPSCAAQALVQALQLSYQICDFYRLHASMWAIESQRAHLEAARSVGLGALAAGNHSDAREKSGQTSVKQTPRIDQDRTEEAVPSSEQQEQSQEHRSPRPKEYIVVCPSHLFEQPGDSLLVPAARLASCSRGTPHASHISVTSSASAATGLIGGAYSGHRWPPRERGVSIKTDLEGGTSMKSLSALAEDSSFCPPRESLLQHSVPVDRGTFAYPAAVIPHGGREAELEKPPASAQQKTHTGDNNSSDEYVVSRSGGSNSGDEYVVACTSEVAGDLKRMRQQHHRRLKNRSDSVWFFRTRLPAVAAPVSNLTRWRRCTRQSAKGQQW
ncbi:zinc c3hc4 type (ring finger) domain-containing protein [Cystoisospora suis]|uniref:RING-type E3 ubiquitin transferase n=1 Tax=Cystoisospora suis TaxID=483139 RepID=A0A2C6LBU9_9APIC|nr:zinc c3hc4 type (ring finger) domain-containing protein [Cystoisospora suis]